VASTAPANEAYYAAEGATDYVTEPYHRARRDIARGFVRSALAELNRPGVVLEVGPGAHPLVQSGELPWNTRSAVMDLFPMPGGEPRVVGNLEQGLPFAARSIDVLVACEVIEHVVETEELLAEFHRVLHPSGRLVLTTPNLATLQDRLRFLLGRSPRQVAPLHRYLRFHVRPFTWSSLAATLSACGFTDHRLRSNYVVWRASDRQIVRSRLLARTCPRLGGSLIVSARPR